MVVKFFFVKNVKASFCGSPGQLPMLPMPESGPETRKEMIEVIEVITPHCKTPRTPVYATKTDQRASMNEKRRGMKKWDWLPEERERRCVCGDAMNEMYHGNVSSVCANAPPQLSDNSASHHQDDDDNSVEEKEEGLNNAEIRPTSGAERRRGRS